MTSIGSARSRWIGKVLLWEDYGIFFGNSGDADLHESPAIKLCISFGGEFGIRDGDSVSYTSLTACVIPAGTPHAINGGGVEMYMLLVAPEGELGQKLSGFSPQLGTQDLTKHHSVLCDSLSPIGNTNEPVLLQRMVSDLVYLVGGISDSLPAEIDPRVAQSIEWIRAGRESGILIKDIAAEVDLSESRFSHLFSEHLRVPVRRYLLWLRLRDALHMLATAENLTAAAHSAGFSDSAHLTRTFRSALGIAPSDLVRHSSVTSFLR